MILKLFWYIWADTWVLPPAGLVTMDKLSFFICKIGVIMQTQWNSLWKVQIELRKDRLPWLGVIHPICNGHPLLSRCLYGRGFPSCHFGRKVPSYHVVFRAVGRFLFSPRWQWGSGESLFTSFTLIGKEERKCEESHFWAMLFRVRWDLRQTLFLLSCSYF